MAKKVYYNGGTQSYYACTEPSALIKGKEYEVISEIDRGWQTDYILNGIKGEFNSVWFDEEFSTYMAIAFKLPKIGEHYICCKIDFANGNPNFTGITTAVVKDIKPMGNNIFKVITADSMYIVKVA